MYTITDSNVNTVFLRGIQLLDECGVTQASQHGETLEMPFPVSVCYDNPRERILFDKERASNPFLNMFEALWIIAGRNDVLFLHRLVERMGNFSDDGVTYYGAYGWRLRNKLTEFQDCAVSCDQMEEAIKRLRSNHDDRQVVLTIRDPADMFYKGKDQPCNLMVACKIRNGKLNIHVFNRSNDFIWGMTGTNVVQFSMLQEYLAGRIGVAVGTYHQTTDSMHVYKNEQWEKLKHKRPDGTLDPYTLGMCSPFPMMDGCGNGDWDTDLHRFFHSFDNHARIGSGMFKTPFFQDVVAPMWHAFEDYETYRSTKVGTYLSDAIAWTHTMAPCDWKLATQLWLDNLKAKHHG